MKVCTKCGEEKELSEFYKAPTNKDGYKGCCIVCYNKRGAKYYRNNREKVAAFGRQYREQNKEKIQEANRRYHEENRDKCNEQSRVYYWENHDEQIERSRRYTRENQEKVQEGARRYYHANSEVIIAKGNERNHSNPSQAKAGWAVNNATRDGRLPYIKTCTCDDCGEQACDYHHESYLPEHRLDVVPLCRACHKFRHRKYK